MNLLIYDNIVIIFHQNGLTIEFHSQTQSLNNCEDKGDSCSDRVKMKKKIKFHFFLRISSAISMNEKFKNSKNLKETFYCDYL